MRFILLSLYGAKLVLAITTVFFWLPANGSSNINPISTSSTIELAAATITNQPKADPGQSIQLEITTHLGDNQTFRKGDVVSFLMSLDTDAYVLILYQDARRHLYQIVPNEKSHNSYFKAGLFIQIPEQSAEYEFSIQPPYGTETLYAFASGKPLPRFKGRVLTGGISRLKMRLSQIKKKIRSHVKKLSASYGETTLQIKTVN